MGIAMMLAGASFCLMSADSKAFCVAGLACLGAAVIRLWRIDKRECITYGKTAYRARRRHKKQVK